MSNKYSTSKIYKLACTDGHYFIGSTVQKLNLRFNLHKSASKTNTSRVYEHINSVGWNNVTIELIEDFPCNSKNELNIREKYYTDEVATDFLCLNNDLCEVDENSSIISSEVEDDGDSDSDSDSDDDDNYESDADIKYDDGKIYKLVSKDGHYYYGSTTTSLEKRFGSHKHSIQNCTYGGNYAYFSTVPIADITIELVEYYPCKSKQELREREDYYIRSNLDNPLCLNTFRAIMTKEDKIEYDKQYYEENKEHVKETMRQYYDEHKDDIKEYQKEYCAENKDKIDEYQALYRLDNAEKRRAYSLQYAKEHPEQVKVARRQRYEENKEKEVAQHKAYNEAHKDEIREYKREWAKKKRAATAEERAADVALRKANRQKKTEARLEHANMVVNCECGGTYQNYRKNRHDSSKLHQKFINAAKTIT